MNNGRSLRCHIPTLTLSSTSYFPESEPSRILTFDRRLFYNAERVRTCNSVVTKAPGLYASVNNSTDPTTGKIIGYISAAGIPSISDQTEQELDVVTPYGVFPTVYFDKVVGLAWWKDMADGMKMQSEF